MLKQVFCLLNYFGIEIIIYHIVYMYVYVVKRLCFSNIMFPIHILYTIQVFFNMYSPFDTFYHYIRFQYFNIF